MIIEAPHLSSELQKAFVSWAQELSGHGILITNRELIVQGWNSWFETNTGLSSQDAIGRSLFDLFPDLRRRRLDVRFRAALNGEVSILSSALHNYLLQIPSRVPELGFEHMQQTARVAPLAHGDEIIGTIAIVDDVTQRDAQTVLLRQQQERAQLLSWALGELLKGTDPENFLHRLLPRVARHARADVYAAYLAEDDGETMRLQSFAGLSSDQARYAETMPASDLCRRTGFASASDAEESGTELAEQLGLQCNICEPLAVGSHRFGAILFGARRRNSFPPDTIEFLRLVTQHVSIALERVRQQKSLRDAKTEIQRHAERLEEMVQERTTSLSEMVTDLESFTYTIAHDLRAPVRFIDGFAKVLLEDYGAEISPQAQKYLHKIQRAAATMEALTRDLLTYSKVSRSGLHLQPVETEALFDEVIAELPALANPGVLTVNRPLHNVVAHPTLLKQCFHNLLQNAIKFIPQGVTPNIHVATSEEPGRTGGSNRRVRISVCDNGIGVDPSLHKKIFGIFERGTNAKQFEGTGIGLAIVAKAVDRMGGSAGVESATGKGSCFWFELPSTDIVNPRAE